MDPVVTFLKEGTLLKDRIEKQRIFAERHRGSSCSRIRNYTSARIQGCICCVFIMRRWKCCWKNYIREFVAVIQEEDPLPIEL